MKTLRSTFAISALGMLFGCSSAEPNDGSEVTGGKGGAPPASGGASSGGAGSTSGGSGNPTAGAQSTGGASKGGSGSGGAGQSQGGAGGATGGAGSGALAGGAAGSLGAAAGQAGGGAAGGIAGSGGAAPGGAGGRAAGAGGAAAGSGGSAPGGAGGTGGAGSFDPCPAAEPCKVLPLGDSITWGINYAGGYRIKLFAKAAADTKQMTFVGYDTANPPSASVLNALGDAKALWAPNHEGHSGWTVQQDDELVLGTSKANNDGVNYTGKKVVADLTPHIVLVHLGTNDFRGDIAGAPDRLGKLIDHVVTDAPNALVVVASVVPYPGGGSAVGTFNKAVAEVVKPRTDAGKHVMFVDMFAALTNADLGTDQVHPNEGGYEKMAVVWYNAIKPYLH